MHHRLIADRLAPTRKMSGLAHHSAVLHSPREAYGANRLVRRAAAGACDARDGHGFLDFRVPVVGRRRVALRRPQTQIALFLALSAGFMVKVPNDLKGKHPGVISEDIIAPKIYEVIGGVSPVPSIAARITLVPAR